MSNFDTDILFPPRLLEQLTRLRSKTWQDYVQEVVNKPVGDIDRIAFIYFMARLCVCATCQGDSLRAIQGCSKCAQQAIKRFRGTDEELIQQVYSYKQEIYDILTKIAENKIDY
ncbi:MAG: hypothetical protein ACPL3P_02230 [Anaerolineales bacterium]